MVEIYLFGEGVVVFEVLEKFGRIFGKGMFMVFSLWGLEKLFEEGETESKERFFFEARFFLGRGGCLGRVSFWFCRIGLWWSLCLGVIVRKLWDRKLLSVVVVVVRGVSGVWDVLWELVNTVFVFFLGGRLFFMGVALKFRKVWSFGGFRVFGGFVRDSSWLWKEVWSFIGGKWGRVGLFLSGSGNSLALRRFFAGRSFFSRVSVDLGLVFIYWCSVEEGLFKR